LLTDRQTDTGENITSLAEVTLLTLPHWEFLLHTTSFWSSHAEIMLPEWEHLSTLNSYRQDRTTASTKSKLNVFAITLKIVQKFSSNLARNYNNHW